MLLLVSQLIPDQGFGQSQVNEPPIAALHTPPFKHGLRSHKSFWISQLTPTRLGGQRQSKPPPNRALHTRLGGHGLEAHSVRPTSQRAPVKPHGHVHVKPLPLGVKQVPPFWHGFVEQPVEARVSKRPC
jgi:hypothetical protein